MESGAAREVIVSSINGNQQPLSVEKDDFDMEINTEAAAREIDAQKKSNMSDVGFAVMFFSVVSTLAILGVFTSKLVVQNEEDTASRVGIASLVMAMGLCLSGASVAGFAKTRLFVSLSRNTERQSLIPLDSQSQSIIPHSLFTDTKMMLREWINKHILQCGAVSAATLYGSTLALLAIPSQSQNPPSIQNAGPIATGYLIGYAVPLIFLIGINLYYVKNNRVAEFQAFMNQLRRQFSMEESTSAEHTSLIATEQRTYSSSAPTF